MTEISSQLNIKEKINAVRSIVPNRSNNEIVLVLQQFDNNVDKAVQAFMDGSALQVLKEWNMTGKKKNSKRKRSKSKQQHYIREMKDKEDGSEKVTLESQEFCGCHLKDCDKDVFSSILSGGKSEVIPQEEENLECKDVAETKRDVSENKAEQKKGPMGAERKYVNSTELPDVFQSSPQSQFTVSKLKSKTPTAKSALHVSHLEIKPEESIKRRGPNIEKSIKDLQRCTASLTRYRMMIKEEVDNSVKKIKAAFAELQSCIIDKEVALMAEIDKVKEEAMEILTARQKKAEELKRLTDLASQMAETQLAELRAEIKHFVSERKYDEELGRSARFSCDIEHLKSQILQCGEISHPKNNYSSRTPSSTLLQSARLHVATNVQNTPGRKSSSRTRAKTPDDKGATAKASSQAASSTTESSPQIPSTNKQNGPSSQRRRFHTQYHSFRINGPLKPPSASVESDQNAPKGSSRNEYRRQHHNSFRPKHKGPIKTQEQSAPAKSMENFTHSEKTRRKHLAPGPTEPRPLCSNMTRVSQYNLCPPRIETSADAPVLSVPAVTLVA
ncbi:SPATS2-like protein isoform X2 [Pogona vitticeps]